MSDPAYLADLCDLVAQQVDPTAIDAEGLYLGLEHLAPGRMKVIATGRVGDVQSHKFAFRRGDVLYGKLRPYLDKAVLADADGVCTTELLVLRPKPWADPRFLACLVHAPNFVEHSMSGVTGAHHPRTSWAHISQFRVPRLDTREQQTTADLLWCTHDLLIACESTEQTTQALKDTAMRELFTRGLRGEVQKETELGLLPESWDVARLGQVCVLSTGTTPSTKDEHYYDGDIPFIKTADVINNRLASASTFISQQAVDDYSLKLFPPGTVLMAMYGQGKTRGQVSLLEIAAATTQNAAAIQPSSAIHPAFLWHYLMSCYERLRGMGSLGHVSHLNLGYLRDLLIVKPPLEDQKDITGILDALDRKIDVHKQKRAVLDDLFKSMLHKLTTGEITVLDLKLSALPPAVTQREEAAS